MSITPNLNEGDLLVMNADLFHKTGAAYSDRIAIRFDFTPQLKFYKKIIPPLLCKFFEYHSSTKKAKYALYQKK